MPKELLKRKLVEKYPGELKKLTPKGQELLVEKLDTKLTAEDEVEDFVNGLENTIGIFVDVVVSESDRRVREASTKPKGKTGTETTEGDEDTNKGKGGSEQEDVPSWAKGLMTSVQSLQQQLAQEKGKNTLNDLVAAAKAKGIPERLASKYVIGETYDQEAALTELEADWADIKQFNVNSSAGDGRTPSSSGAGGTKDVSAAIKSFAKANVEAAKVPTK
ncbi:hypothetical protein GCM10023149_48530 [Mucilaginibacter gynuensis]|uniref:Scaffolding protein n=1 Tax=Mucilaginibacter gynuensis TaxID=1302236 RepID=A0ABP8HF61_9SPHI